MNGSVFHSVREVAANRRQSAHTSMFLRMLLRAAVLRGRGVVAPFALVVARTSDGEPIVVAGTDFDRVKQLDHWWSVSGWPSASGQALVGVRALPTVSARNQPFDLSFRGHTVHLTSAGTV